VHVLQFVKHGWQVLVWSAYCPLGQLEVQAPLLSTSGELQPPQFEAEVQDVQPLGHGVHARLLVAVQGDTWYSLDKHTVQLGHVGLLTLVQVPDR